jgi:pimeloyl-ACP methyl ester carboxylesterase
VAETWATDHNPVVDEPAPRLWPGAPVEAPHAVPVTRLTPHSLSLPGGQRIGVMVGGQGIPLVVAHGFSFAGAVYVQSLSRLATMGFRVIAVDLAGHGNSAALARRGWELDEYRRFLACVLDELGVRRAVLCGHSLGGRLVAELAASEPERAVALLLIDAAVGRAWDDVTAFCRWAPSVFGVVGATLAADTFGTLFFSGDQSLKLQGLVLPQAMANLVAPWRLINPALSVLLAPGSASTLDRIGFHGLPVFILHGDRDPVVPLASARDAARRTGGQLLVVRHASHSWLLEDPETLRAIVARLLGDGLGQACLAALAKAGLDPHTVSQAEVERAFYAPDARVHELSPGPFQTELRPLQPPRFSWTPA